MKTEVKAAIIGFGYMGRRHLAGYELLPEVSATAGAARSAQTRKRAENEFGLKAYSDIGAMLDEEKPNVVSICSPTHLHEAHSLECVRRGIHILVEKPLAGDINSSRRIVDSARSGGVKLMVGHTNLFAPSILKMLALAGKGAVGQIRKIRIIKTGSDISPGDKEKGIHLQPEPPGFDVAEIVYDDLIHLLYCVDKAAGAAPDYVLTERLGGGRYREKVKTEIGFKNGVIASVGIDADLEKPLGKEFTIVGDLGSITWRLLGNAESLELSKNGKRQPLRFERGDVFSSTVKYFVYFVQNDMEPYADGEHAIRTMQMARAVIDSFRNGEKSAKKNGGKIKFD